MRLARPEIQIIKQDTNDRILFDFCNSINIASSFETLTDTARLVLPDKIKVNGRTISLGQSDIIQKGDRITIAYGYFETGNYLEFEGFVSGIGYRRPLEVMCEDLSWELKYNPINYEATAVTLEKLAAAITEGTEIVANVAEAELGQFRISNATPAQVLEEVRNTYGLDSYIFNGQLVIGFQSPPGYIPVEHIFEFEKNIISDNLEYVEAEDYPIKFRVVCMNKDNTKTEVEAGDPNGSLSTITLFNIEPDNEAKRKEKMKAYAEELLPKYKYSGLRGSITVFGIPSVKHGDNVRLISRVLPIRNGLYIVDAVDKTYSYSEGIRQNIKLGRKIGE